eukprot:TRINITY_DN11951_c0_g1_i1.p1 TRINITY_DN11951_c0_g1~~TRINITY_DN11951_c0_g1_i1.p1  ORF type:complete len:152 (-),score=10.59 TRINITY_DN11951_c0_g1_i1:74-502(-)
MGNLFGSPHYVLCHDTGFVLDVEGQKLTPGSHIIVWHKKYGHEAQTQRWVQTEDGFIHVEHHPNLVLEVAIGGDIGTKVNLGTKKLEDNQNQKWYIEENLIYCHLNGLVLSVAGGSHREGAHVIVTERKHDDNYEQFFSFVQ